ncbi:MAG TPA: hypothetical protein V6D22_14040 [Candidatus Obscuribacterales bacterium]
MSLVWPDGVRAEEPTAALKSGVETSRAERIDEIDRSLMLAFIDLARFNIRFHQGANRQISPWRLLYPAGREAGTAVSFASSTMDLRQRLRAIRRKRVDKDSVRNILNVALVGNLVSGSVSSMELAQNTWVMLRATKNGYSPRDSEAHVREMVATTDALFKERRQLVAATEVAGRRQVFQIEDRLLRRIRQQLLYEFATWSAHSRDTMWRENTFYALDAGQNFTRAGAVMTGLRALNRPRLGGPSAITTLVASGLATVDPIIAILAGIAVHHYQITKLAREFPVERPDARPGESWDELEHTLTVLQQSSPTERRTRLLHQAANLASSSQMFDTSLDKETAQIQRLRQVAQQQAIVGPAIGLTAVTGSTLGTIAFYGYRTHRTSSAHLLLATRLSVMPGQAVALAYTPFAMILAAKKYEHLKKRGELPAQLLAERLRNLDALEELVKQH